MTVINNSLATSIKADPKFAYKTRGYGIEDYLKLSREIRRRFNAKETRKVRS